MWMVDTALQRRIAEGKPVRVAMIGAGYMGRGIAVQIVTGVSGMELVAIANRTIAGAERAYREAGVERVRRVDSAAALQACIERGEPAVTDDPDVVCEAAGVEAIIEVRGDPEQGAHVVLKAFEHGKHMIAMNAELDSTVGPILKTRADSAGVVYTNTDGDEPGVAMNLFRFVKTIGYRPVAAGNIKGFIDPYRTPDTQRAFAEKVGQDPKMITSFADGTKLSMEACVLANATGFGVGRRGMHGPKCSQVKDVIGLLPAEEMLGRGIVDYTLGAEPGTGAFVVGYSDHPRKQEYMRYFKMGDGPFYCFYTPYHLPHVQISMSVARAVLFHDATVAPAGAPSTDVVTVAKRNLAAGETLDGIGGFLTFGTIENYARSRADDLLPMGLSDGCRLRRAVPKDRAISYADVDLPEGRLIDRLRSEQTARFG
jgi:predicted homoserine dehydrogenase-like protein